MGGSGGHSGTAWDTFGGHWEAHRQPQGSEKVNEFVTCSLVGHGSTWEFVIFGMNGVEMKRHGLILWENDATWLKIVLKLPPGPNNLFKK